MAHNETGTILGGLLLITVSSVTTLHCCANTIVWAVPPRLCRRINPWSFPSSDWRIDDAEQKGSQRWITHLIAVKSKNYSWTTGWIFTKHNHFMNLYTIQEGYFCSVLLNISQNLNSYMPVSFTYTQVNCCAGFADAHPIHRHILLMDQQSVPSLVLGDKAIRIHYT